MSLQLKAVYRDGTFVLREPCDLPAESEVELTIQGPITLPPVIKDPEQRANLLKLVTQRMQQNAIPQGAARFTREALHERR